MNVLKKAYCRTFQTIFKLAIPILPYRTPKQLDTIVKIADVLSEKKINNIFSFNVCTINDIFNIYIATMAKTFSKEIR